MSLRLRLISWLTSPLLLTLIPSFLPSYFLSTTAQAQTTQDRKIGADRLLEQGNQQYQRSQYKDAIQFWQQALAIYQQLKDRKGEANSLNNLGLAYRNWGQYPKAIEFYQQSLAIVREIGDRNGEANSLGNLGNAYYFLGQYPKAIEFYQQSLAIQRAIGNRNGEANPLGNLGNAYFSLGQYPKAIEFYQQSLAIQRAIGDRKGEANSLANLGSVYFSLGQYPKAIEFYQQSSAIFREIGNRNGEAASVNNLGLAYRNLGQYPKAIEFYQQSLAIFREIGDRNGEAQSLNNLGVAYKSLGQYPKAIEFYQQSLAIFREIGDRNREAQSLGNLGGAYYPLGQPELAIVFYKQSINVQEGIRQDLRKLSREQQESYTQTVADTYRGLADLLLSQGRVLEAQQVLELLKIQELRDFTRDTRAGGETQGSPLNPSESRVVPPYDSVINVGLKLTECERKPPYCPERDQLRSLRDTANQKFNQEVKRLSAIARQQRGKDPAQLAQEELTVAAQKVVTAQPKTVLIYPLVLDDKLWLVWGTQAGKQGVVFNSKLVVVGRKELATTVVKFRQLLEQPGDEKELQQVSQKLYQWLIAPLRAELDANNIQNLVFSLDRSTRYIPMAALFDGKKYLVESFNTSTILTSGLTNTNEKLSPKIEDDPVLGLGLSDAVPNFNPLPNVKDEINAIIRTASNPNGIYPGLSRLNKDFSKDAFKDLINYRILHIATHGKFVSGNPENSFLLLGNGNKFNITEIKNLTDLGGIHLVVLSACETARGGEDQEGIEVSGISYYFLTSGAKSVIASLWLVNDASTSQLMRLFYENLATGKMTKTAALRQAQLSMIAGKTEGSGKTKSSVKLEPGNSGQNAPISRNLSHPYYWSPFILIGNGL